MSVQVKVNILSPAEDSTHTVGPKKGVPVTVEAWAEITGGGGGGGGGDIGGGGGGNPPVNPNDPHRRQPLDDTSDGSPERRPKNPIKILGGQKIDVDSVKVKLGDGEFKTLRSIGNNRYTGSTGTVSKGGTMKITAKAMHAGIPGDGVVRSSVDRREIKVVVEDSEPEIEITSPDDGDEIEMVGQEVEIEVKGKSSDVDSNVDRVYVGVGRANSRVSGSLSRWSHRGVTLKGIDSHTIKARAIDEFGNENNTWVRVKTIDAGKPELEITSPQQDATFDWPADGNDDLTIEVEGTARDEETDVKVVEWRLGDEGEDNYKEAETENNWSQWKAKVPLHRPGKHTIHVRCFDEAKDSNKTEEAITIHARRKAEFEGDPASRRSYLKELFKMATRRLKTTDNGNIDAQVLAETFYQPFELLSSTDTTVRKIATRPVHQIRICIEVLRRFLGKISDEAETSYCKHAYQVMLRNLGASYEELHRVRSEKEETRESLGQRLGIASVHLDDLFLDIDTIEEDDLERLFGLADTRHHPLSGSTDPVRQSELLGWRREYLRMLWRQRDHAEETVVPILDPDLVSRSDLKSEDSLAYELWKEREEQVKSLLSDIKEDHEESAVENFDELIGEFLEEDLDFDLRELAEEREKGVDIKDQLKEADLDLDAFLYLERIRRMLEKEREVLDSEWKDLFDILLQVQKRRHMYPDWMAEEQKKGLTLSPDYFKIGEKDNTGPPQVQSQWRVGSQTRRRWEETLQTRIRQRENLERSLREDVEAAEEVALPELRKSLLDKMGKEHKEIDILNWLTKRLLIDVSSSSDRKTTRLRQATETMQNILFSVRTGRFNTLPVLDNYKTPDFIFDQEQDYTESDFDREWDWLGTYKSFQAGMAVFMYPENYLLPGIWAAGISGQKSTPAFQKLTTKLRNNFRLTPEAARKYAEEYLEKHIEKLRTDLPDDVGLPDDFQLTERRSSDELVEHRELVKGIFKAKVEKGNHPHQSTIPNYLKEIFFFVPVQIALQLEKADEYLAALDWFQLVYAYELSPDKDRKIYYGLELEEHVENDYREPDWLQESFNPHQIVISTSKRAEAYTRFTLMSLVRCFLDYADAEFARETAESLPKARDLYLTALEQLNHPALQPPEDDESPFPLNDLPVSLRRHAEANLNKLRQGRNIAGLQLSTGLQLDTTHKELKQASPYRYAVLIERAKQLVSIAQQIEANYLSTLEKRDREAYTLLQAVQDVELTKATIELQDLRIEEAESNLELAGLQQQKAEIRKRHYQSLLSKGKSENEKNALEWMKKSLIAPDSVSASYGIGEGLMSISTSYSPSGKMNTWANILSTRASYNRRKQQWELQKSLADQDIDIGEQQKKVSQDHLDVVGQEREIAAIEVGHAEASVQFLATKFTNTDLYDWMSGVLSRVYAYFLQQAASTARLAQRQLVFQRQVKSPSVIQTDYWSVSKEVANTPGNENGKETDRRGMTGSARLLEDIHQLDQYAFETKERKLQLSQTFSLARLTPYEFQRFRETGMLLFDTLMELFDQAFPGHYMRLIKHVRISVVALVPPTEGIRATLSASGISRVVTGDQSFQTSIVRRGPEEIAFTSPTDASGLLELEPEKQDLFFPFEGMGVDTSWELQMPKAANSFDYSTIADVLVTIDYTALSSQDYRRQVIRELDRTVSADRSFSFRQQFSDRWYDLHNPAQTGTPMTVEFKTRREDFPPNLEELKIEQILLYFVREGGASFEIDVEHLHLTQGDITLEGDKAISIDGIISTRRSNGADWANKMIGKRPSGTWELALPNTEKVRNRFAEEEIEDIMFVITFKGKTPEWPE